MLLAAGHSGGADMVSRSYMLEKPPGPSGLGRFVHWRVAPAVINSLGDAELRLEQFRLHVRKAPIATLACAVALGAFLAHRRSRR